MADKDVPDHSKAPESLETPNVISVGTVETLTCFKNAIKLAAGSALSYIQLETLARTICGRIQDNEACINIDSTILMFVSDGICMTSQAVTGFVQIHIVVSTFQGPESSQAAAARTNNCDSPPLHYLRSEGA